MGILVAVVAGFASGVGLRSLFTFSWPVIVFILIIAALFVGAALRKPRRAYSLGAMFFIFVAFGMIRAMVADTPLPEAFARDVKHRVSYEAVVVADPDVRDANQRVEVKVLSGKVSTIMLAVAPRYPSVAVGDRITVSGTLAIPEAFADPPSPAGSGETGGRIFRYDKYLQRDGVRFILNFAYLRVQNDSVALAPLEIRILTGLARIKHSFLNGLAATLPEPYASLAGGVVIGGKSGLGTELQNAFIRSGLVQIVVLSGYNVMVVAEWVMAALALTPLKKRWGAAAGAFAILVFVGIAGTTATALRAALMAFIALYARATGRSYSAGRALLFVVFLMLVWNPLYLAFDPGFGLSIAATAGLIWLAPIIETLLSGAVHFRKVSAGRKVFESEPSAATPPNAFRHEGSERNALKNFSPERTASFWTNAVATTLAAQVAVLPLLLYDTGNLSLVAIPANLLTMPMVPLAMGLSALAGFAGIFFGKILPLLGIVLAFPAYVANAYIIFIAQGSAALPFAAFTLPPFPFWLVLCAYAALIFIASSKRFSTTLQFKFAKKAST